MSEKQPMFDQEKSPLPTPEVTERLADTEKAIGKDTREVRLEHALEKIAAKKEVEQALSGHERISDSVEKSRGKHTPITPVVKQQQYQATMRRVESKLSPTQRVFSKFIHADGVDAASRLTAKTIARPSGLFGGALLSFVGLVALYFFSHRIGFEYNASSAFLVLMVFGWVVGILIEYILGALRRLRSR
jgi:hypothetical protein